MIAPVWNPKVRWHDYVLAVLAADFMSTFLLRGFSADTWWEPIVYGLCVGIIWDLWNKNYCNYRLKQEFKKFSTEVNEYMKDLLENKND